MPLASSARADQSVTFTDIAEQAGLGSAVNVAGSPRDKQFLIEEMGAGVALFDFDNDGWLDIFLVNGTTFTSSAGARKPTSYLFRNNRDGTFSDVTEKAGFTYSGWGQGCCVGDFDNDGYEDLFVSYWGKNILYHNNGDGTFTDVSKKAGVAGSGDQWGAGCCFLDYDRDGHLDLFVANYVNFDALKSPRPANPRIADSMTSLSLVGRKGLAAEPMCCIAIAETAPLKMCRRNQALLIRAGQPQVNSSRRIGVLSAPMEWEPQWRTLTMMVGRIFTLPAIPRRACCIATTTTARSARLVLKQE